MTEQLALIDIPAAPKLTEKQQYLLDAVLRARHDGVHADEIGAQWHQRMGKHPDTDRCRFCGSDGKDALEALKKKGLVRYRRANRGVPGVWLIADAEEPLTETPTKPGCVPYGEFPEGF